MSMTLQPSYTDTRPQGQSVSVTACICTHNRTHYLRHCLESLRQQTVGPDAFDIVVVDSKSSRAVAEEIQHLVAESPNAQLIRVEEAGLSLARNAGALAARGDYVAYLDDDALAAPDWIEQIMCVVQELPVRPAVLSGRALPIWEAPLPGWWPDSLRGILTITEWEGRGEYRTSEVPAELGPYGANLVVERAALLAVSGFAEDLGRRGGLLLSDEDVHLAWKLQDSGRSARHDSRITVHHCIQAVRLTPSWLLQRLYWQGASSVLTRLMLGDNRLVWSELPRRLALVAALAPLALMPVESSALIGLRWRLAYAQGFVSMALGELRIRAKKAGIRVNAHTLQESAAARGAMG
ncbi:glycosyltransferase [Belnapia sp. T18]|uniref:Glycosyltransferase n=1 Tax=Belnapia arida TaxID=2804533 RepID=A0ABS1U4A4_9PROT|nr:glycosyltransferase [Belnapia arida]MBL6079506.1 glycosyltransferase [Belnapia arida]